MRTQSETLIDYSGRSIRLTDERWSHILEHPEMDGQRDRIEETLKSPDAVIASSKDQTVHVYHRLYDNTPVTRKYLVVVVKLLSRGGFILTAYFTSQLKRGKIVWQK